MNRVESHGSLYYLLIRDIRVRLSWKKETNKQFPRNDHVKKERKKKKKKICPYFTVLLKNKLSF